MATHSSILAWKIPWTEEPGRLQSMGSQRIGHNWVTSLKLYHSLWHSGGRREWGELREQHGNIYLTMWKTDSKWELAIWHRELNPVFCDNLEGWDEMGDGTQGLGGREHVYTCGWFVVMYGRGQHDIIEQLSFNNCILFCISQYCIITIFNNY